MAESLVIIGGCGHVGLPLALAFADEGLQVAALDVNEETVSQVNGGHMPFVDAGADEALTRVLASGRFRATSDPTVLEEADTVITIIGTPVDEYLNPRFGLMRDVLSSYVGHLRSGQLFILRSTVFPGTTALVERQLREAGLDLDVAYCPERVAEGAALEEVRALPQIVSGTTKKARKRAEELFLKIAPEVVLLPPQAAELAKLFTNAWRYIQFATANQFYMIAQNYGLDFYEVHEAMTRNYPRAKNFPRAGFAAGPCLFKDTMQLSAFQKNQFFLGHSAMLINEGLPAFLVDQAAGTHDLENMTVGILGMTFKADSDDPRDSLSFKLRRILETRCRRVLCTDPYLDEPWILPIEELLENCDLLFVGAPHSAYRDLDVDDLPVVDVWNHLKRRQT